jgi:hypothetical protein
MKCRVTRKETAMRLEDPIREKSERYVHLEAQVAEAFVKYAAADAGSRALASNQFLPFDMVTTGIQGP